MSVSDGEKNLLAVAKQGEIDRFNLKPDKKKANQLFHRYGTDLPTNIINFLRDEAGKYVDYENSIKSNAKDESNRILVECYTAIHWHGMQKTRAYEKYSVKLNISESAFQKRYLRKYPPGCDPYFFPPLKLSPPV